MSTPENTVADVSVLTMETITMDTAPIRKPRIVDRFTFRFLRL